MTTQSTQPNKEEKPRENITTGYYWLRYPMMVLMAIFGLNLLFYPSSWTYAILLLVSIGLFFLFRRSKRMYYDDENLYILRHKNEEVVPFTDIISIKKSRAKVNGSRFWILLYTNKRKEEKKVRFYRMFFYRAFHQAVKKVNPAVVIWEHPFFNH